MRISNRKSSAACPTAFGSLSPHMRPTVLVAILLTFLPHAAAVLAPAVPPPPPRVLPVRFQKSGPLAARRLSAKGPRAGDLAAQDRRQLKIRGDRDDSLSDETVHQPLQNKGILYLANVTVGTPPQPMQLQIDTASSDIWVLSKSIPACFQPNSYDLYSSSCSFGSFDPPESRTFNLLGKDRFGIVYVDGTSAVGDYAADTFSVGGATVQGMQIGVAKETNLSYGVMGVGFEGDQASVTPGASDTGSILFGGVDTARFIGNLTTIPIELAPGQTEPLAFAIPLTAVAFSDGRSHINITSKYLPAVVVLDSGSSLTFLPHPIASSLANQFSAKFSHQLNLYVIDCHFPSQNAFVEYSFSFVMSIRVPVSELILPLTQYSGGAAKGMDGSDICVLGILPSNSSISLFGDTFLRSAYIVYDLDNKRIAMAQTEFNPRGQNIEEIGVGWDGIPYVGIEAMTIMAMQTIDVTSTAHTGAVAKSAASLTAASEVWEYLLAFTMLEMAELGHVKLEEEAALPATSDLPQGQLQAPAVGWLRRFRRYNAAQVDKRWTSIPVLATSYVSGLTDSAAYNAWSCFISMQTGNTVFVGLGASHQPLNKPMGWLSSLLSITCFMIGVASIAFCSRKAGSMLRGTLVASFFLQAVFIIIAAALVQSKVVPIASAAEQESGRTEYHYIALVPLAFLAFQAGGQIVVSRAFGHNHIPSIVLTSLYSDLVADPLFFQPVNVKRNERTASAVLVLTGAITGGWIMRNSSMAAVLWFAAGIKFVIMLTFMAWPSEKSKDISLD
ncbi:Candidapepsin-8 [Drechslerella dactyloides]|uniref:Candidapepsin-8 n=1 Tax=Drechslerella dactyloides TaxID=74499 RepID=A0AAD6NPK0_DREDA|nr:Candidapepsin-8 [Drechslerella dactyloides]